MTINMRNVTQDIIKMKIEDEDTLATLRNRFYRIMAKHGIKMGTKTGHGVRTANPEWTACEILFYSRIHSKLEMDSLWLESVPKKLWY